MAIDVKTQIRNKLGTRLIRQAGGDSLSVNEDGSVNATVVYKCDWMALLQVIPRPFKSSHPDFPSLICKTVTTSKENPGIASLTVTYAGIINNGGPGISPTTAEDSTVTSCTVSVRQEPIETHPNFNDSDFAGTPDSPNTTNAIFNEDGSFSKFKADSEFAGLETFLLPSVTFSVSYVSETPPASLAGVGSIDTPSNAPSVKAGYNWLKTGISYSRAGGYYNINEDWTLSGPKGWNSKVYPE